MPVAKDQTVALLTEIRDLLKANQEALQKTKETSNRSRVLHYIFNTLIILLVMGATYFYYHTLMSAFGS